MDQRYNLKHKIEGHISSIIYLVVYKDKMNICSACISLNILGCSGCPVWWLEAWRRQARGRRSQVVWWSHLYAAEPRAEVVVTLLHRCGGIHSVDHSEPARSRTSSQHPARAIGRWWSRALTSNCFGVDIVSANTVTNI